MVAGGRCAEQAHVASTTQSVDCLFDVVWMSPRAAAKLVEIEDDTFHLADQRSERH